ncbi:MAG: prohibitin 1 [Nonlabens sp.]|jgi:regulator of protease activity HflC (stomatin/prohibitin superfamily)|uniref:prohibitin family protein n=1 Tax=Nonlabens sp. MB-3u-79 TaxID=2058134 RepID=UPI000C31A098|nr:prohibitin family protein [Nonlabens sp. MB-3u-79]AUC79789.1 peptidase [Nonlabens sp. MB-3u-79]|tara:strand:- start:33832 stop:34647 length:816 start_codon:yes stop_codon:yes gene_type:complete
MQKLPKAAVLTLVGLVILAIIIIKSSVVIESGQAGVLFKTLDKGVDRENTYGEGFHIIAPWNDMIIYPVRQLSVSDKMRVLSVNGLEVTVDGTVWYQPEYNKLPYLHQEKGRNYESAILAPAISAAARSVVGRYTPEQLYSSKRDVIQNEILEEVQRELASQYIQVNRVLVEDVTLPIKIKEAIERKLRQEQESLEYEFRLTKASKEAERQRIDAEGKAVANKILSASLTDKILTEKGIEATLELAKSPNSKVIVIGGGENGSLPIILGNQ